MLLWVHVVMSHTFLSFFSIGYFFGSFPLRILEICIFFKIINYPSAIRGAVFLGVSGSSLQKVHQDSILLLPKRWISKKNLVISVNLWQVLSLTGYWNLSGDSDLECLAKQQRCLERGGSVCFEGKLPMVVLSLMYFFKSSRRLKMYKLEMKSIIINFQTFSHY